MTRVVIVILNWNGIDDTETCITSLLDQSYSDFHILVVDNGSVDDSVNRLKNLEAKHNQLTLIVNQINRGFAGGVNDGIHYALNNNYDYISLFNNDAVAETTWLEILVKSIQSNKDVSAITGLLLHSDKTTIDSTGEIYTSWGMSFPRNRTQNIMTAPISGNVFGATGGATLYKTSLFKEIGLFDETFFAYYEDADISFRAQLAGHKIYYEKTAVAYHEQGATSSKIPGFTVYQTFKNLPLLFWKNIPTKLLLKVGSRFLILYILIFGNAIKNGAGLPAFKGVLASIGYFWTSAIWKRFKIQHNKKVSASYIWSILYHDLPPEQTGMRKFRDFLKNNTEA